MDKKTVLIIGEGMQCSIKDGITWHLNLSGYKLSDLLEKKYNLCKGDLQDWNIKSEIFYFRSGELTHSFLNQQVLGAIFDFKKLSKKNIKKSQEIFSYLQTNFPNIRLLNSPADSKLFSSKIEFSKHVYQLQNAKSLLPECATLETNTDLDSAIHTIGLPFLIKPDSLASGKGIVKIEDRETALKILKDSHKGIYYKSNWAKIKDGIKKIIFRRDFSKPQQALIKLLINEFIDTYHKEYNCYINANVYYWMGELCYADSRVSHSGYNIHAGDSSNEKLTIDQYAEITTRVMKLIFFKICICRNLNFNKIPGLLYLIKCNNFNKLFT